jgi:hypothetical protein
MKLTPISIEEVTEEFYTDYCMDCTDDGETPLEQSEWMKLEEVKQSIKNVHSLFGKIREQK